MNIQATPAHIIFCNDIPELVVLGSAEKAKERLEELRNADYERHNKFSDEPFNEYKLSCTWHIRDVEMEVL